MEQFFLCQYSALFRQINNGNIEPSTLNTHHVPAPDEIVPSLHQYIELLYGIVFQYSIHLANMALLQSGTWVNHASCAGAKSLVLGNAQINVEAHFICEDTCLGYLTSTLRYPSLHVSWII